MKQTIQCALQTILRDMGVTDVVPIVEASDKPEHGDYTTNVAMQLTKQLKKSPIAIGTDIIERCKNDPVLMALIAHIEIIGPGFINMTVTDTVLTEHIGMAVSQKGTYGKTNPLADQKIMVEYTDPNPFKELHIGHLYSNAFGESVARLLTFAGATVKRADYFGDVGMHVAKTIWGLKKKLREEKKTMDDIGLLPLPERIHYLGSAYVIGTNSFEEDSETGKQAAEEMKEINALVYAAAQEYIGKESGWKPRIDYKKYAHETHYTLADITSMYTLGKSWSMEYFKQIFHELGTEFDYFYPESMTGEYGTELVQSNMGNVFETSENAVIFRGEKFGLHTRVFMNALGLPTYEAKELGLAVAKYRDFPFDRCINITGNEINDYFAVVLAALERINPDLAAKITHIGHGMVRMPEGKMSSRTGNVLTAQWFMDEVKKHILDVIKTTGTRGETKDTDTIINAETVAAIKYSFLKVTPPSNIIFDIDTSVSLEGNSGPYIQYTFARCSSVLEKQTKEMKKQSNPHTPDPFERSVARRILFFPDVVTHAAISYAPSELCAYLYDLAQEYNLFYAHDTVVGGSEEAFRIALTHATANVLQTGLSLLGIPTVTHM